MNYVGECGSGYQCGLCEGDCDGDSDCAGDLVCVQRNGFDVVAGCSGSGGDWDLYGKDICAEALAPSPTPDFLNSLKFNDAGCSESIPCGKCEGPCDTNSCSLDLTCFNRIGDEPVPGCVTGGGGDISDISYCYEAPTDGIPTYIPGDLTKVENGLILSTGLTSTIIARTGNRVSYADGGRSSKRFHEDPDAGAVFNVTSGLNEGG